MLGQIRVYDQDSAGKVRLMTEKIVVFRMEPGMHAILPTINRSHSVVVPVSNRLAMDGLGATYKDCRNVGALPSREKGWAGGFKSYEARNGYDQDFCKVCGYKSPPYRGARFAPFNRLNSEPMAHPPSRYLAFEDDNELKFITAGSWQIQAESAAGESLDLLEPSSSCLDLPVDEQSLIFWIKGRRPFARFRARKAAQEHLPDAQIVAESQDFIVLVEKS